MTHVPRKVGTSLAKKANATGCTLGQSTRRQSRNDRTSVSPIDVTRDACAHIQKFDPSHSGEAFIFLSGGAQKWFADAGEAKLQLAAPVMHGRTRFNPDLA